MLLVLIYEFRSIDMELLGFAWVKSFTAKRTDMGGQGEQTSVAIHNEFPGRHGDEKKTTRHTYGRQNTWPQGIAWGV